MCRGDRGRPGRCSLDWASTEYSQVGPVWQEILGKVGCSAGSDEARKIRALFSARGGAWGGGWPSDTELVHHFTGLDQAQLLTGDGLDPRRIASEGLDLPGGISVDLVEAREVPL